MKVEITYDNGLLEVAQRIESNLSEIIAAGAEVVCSSAKSMCPVDTGTLQSSIGVSTEGNRATVSADADYAAYVEFGTSKMAPQPYLMPALLGNYDAILSEMASAIKG